MFLAQRPGSRRCVLMDGLGPSGPGQILPGVFWSLGIWSESVCVSRRKVLLFLSWSQRSLFNLLDLPG